MKCQARANLWWPSSKSMGPPPQISGLEAPGPRRASGTCQAVGLKPALLLMRMVSGRSADFAGVDEGPGAHNGRVEDEVFVDPQGLVGGSRGRDHLVGFGQGERHRLLERRRACRRRARPGSRDGGGDGAAGSRPGRGREGQAGRWWLLKTRPGGTPHSPARRRALSSSISQTATIRARSLWRYSRACRSLMRPVPMIPTRSIRKQLLPGSVHAFLVGADHIPFISRPPR